MPVVLVLPHSGHPHPRYMHVQVWSILLLFKIVAVDELHVLMSKMAFMSTPKKLSIACIGLAGQSRCKVGERVSCSTSVVSRFPRKKGAGESGEYECCL